MFQKVTGMFLAVLLAGALASLSGCSSRGEDQLSAGEYPFAGPPAENSYDGRSKAAPRSRGTQVAVSHRIDPGSIDYYGQWAYAYGRDPSYDYYLAGSEGYGYGWYDDEEFPDEYSYFHDELDPYGDWYEDDRYGWIWYPEYVSVGWRPYLYGRWVYTDWGWAWVSDDPWGSNTYHYGRWDCDASNRWFWVPDDVWAPAWVSWRYGGGWCGWAPLPPEARWSGVTLAYSDYLVPSTRWCFVPEGRLTSTRLRTYVAPIPEGRRIFRETRDVTRYASVSGRAAERGLRSDWIERRTGRNIPEHRMITRERGSRRDLVRGRTVVAPMPLSPRTSERFRGRSGARERLEGRTRFEDRARIDRGDRWNRGDRSNRGDRGDRWNRVNRGNRDDRWNRTRDDRWNRTRDDRANRMRDLREERARSRGYERQQIQRERDFRQQREFQRERSQRQQEFRQRREQQRQQEFRQQRQQEFRDQRERARQRQEFRDQRERARQEEFRGQRERARQQEFRDQRERARQQEFQRQRGFEQRDQRREERDQRRYERGNSERRRSEMMFQENQRQQEQARNQQRLEARQRAEQAWQERREQGRRQAEQAQQAQYERREQARQQAQQAQFERREQARQQAQQAQVERREQGRQQAEEAQSERRQHAEQARSERRQRAERRQQQQQEESGESEQPRGHGRGRGNR